MSQDITTKSSTGLDANIAALLCYLALWITGLIFFFVEKESRFVRFHAMQSIVVFGGLSLLSWLLGELPLGWLLFPVIWIIQLILWIVLMYKAYNWELFKLPLAGDIAEKQAENL